MGSPLLPLRAMDSGASSPPPPPPVPVSETASPEMVRFSSKLATPPLPRSKQWVPRRGEAQSESSLRGAYMPEERLIGTDRMEYSTDDVSRMLGGKAKWETKI